MIPASGMGPQSRRAERPSFASFLPSFENRGLRSPDAARAALAVRCWSGVHIGCTVFVAMRPGSAEPCCTLSRRRCVCRAASTHTTRRPREGGDPKPPMSVVGKDVAPASLNTKIRGYGAGNRVRCRSLVRHDRDGDFRFKFCNFRSAQNPRSAACARVVAPFRPRKMKRAQGRPGARCTRGLACQNAHWQKAHTSIQVQREHSGLPCAVVSGL
jgi:hypothetical protein